MLMIGGFFINFKRQREQKQVNSLFYRKKKIPLQDCIGET